MFYIGIPLLALLFMVTIFYFWASSGNLDEKEYSRIFTYYTPEKPTEDDVFTVVTYNIGYLSGMFNNTTEKTPKSLYENNLKRVIELLQSVNPHIIGFQEIDFAANRSYYVNQFEEIAKAVKYPYGAWAVNWDKKYLPFPYFPPTVHFGNILSGQAILSRFPIEKHQRIALERVASHPFYYDAFYIDRLLEIAELRVNNKKLVLMNVHLEAFDAPTRRNQTIYIRNVYQEISKFAPVLLIGDFNSTPPSKEMPETEIDILLKAENIASACPESQFHLPFSYTFPSDNPQEQLDYIFYNPDRIEKIDWSVLSSFGDISDHFPVMMKFKIK